MSSAARPAKFDVPDRLLALALLVAGLASRLPFVGRDEGWFDEHYSIITSSQTLFAILRNALLEQSNPPGYYLLAHIWGLFGDAGSLEWHRIVPAVCGALVPMVATLAIRRLGFSRAAATAAGVLLVVAPVPWNLSLEVRGYATLALLAACSLYVAAGIIASKAAPSRRSLITLASLHVAQVLMHYFGAFAVLGVSLAVADSERRRVGGDGASQRRTFAGVAATLGAPAALSIAAWIGISFAVFRGVGGGNVDWIPETSTWSAVVNLSSMMLANLTVHWGTWMSRALLLAGTVLAAVAALRHGTDAPTAARGRSTLLLTLAPLAAALLLNALGGNGLWVQRYIAVLTPALTLLVATAVDAVVPRWRSVTAFGIAAWWAVAGVHRFGTRVPKPDWTRIMTALAPRGEATICADGSFVGLPFVYQSNVSGQAGIVVLNAANCRLGHGITWLVYDVKPNGLTPPPGVPGLVLGPRVVLFRGLQNLDARRVLVRNRAAAR